MERGSPASSVEPALALPTPSKVDTIRDVIVAAANLKSTGALAAVLGSLNEVIPRALDRRRAEFYDAVANKLLRVDGDLGRLDERLALASLSTGVLAAARSACEEHHDHLASATAHAMVNPQDLSRDHCILILRLIGDLTAAHVHVLAVFSDPHGVAARHGGVSWWCRDAEGQYPRDRLLSVDDDLAQDLSVARQIASDLGRMDLVGSDWAGQFERGLVDAGTFPDDGEPDPASPPHGATDLGKQVLGLSRAPLKSPMPPIVLRSGFREIWEGPATLFSSQPVLDSVLRKSNGLFIPSRP
ncbi:hypothetical protein [Ilumatobacter sp.]|uniref:hypothetical protein n=1 Tax=Ilumatobacter sp. TaxID=1967498 RepID=UPI003B51BA5C